MVLEYPTDHDPEKLVAYYKERLANAINDWERDVFSYMLKQWKSELEQIRSKQR
jgi:hypothetical protein